MLAQLKCNLFTGRLDHLGNKARDMGAARHHGNIAQPALPAALVLPGMPSTWKGLITQAATGSIQLKALNNPQMAINRMAANGNALAMVAVCKALSR